MEFLRKVKRVFALVVTHSDDVSGYRETDIKAHLQVFAARGAISKYGIPDKIQFVDRLANTNDRKIDKKLLREKYAHIAQLQTTHRTSAELRSRHDALGIVTAEPTSHLHPCQIWHQVNTAVAG